MDWAVRSDAQNRPMRMTVTYDMGTGREASREGFADGHVIDRVVGYGIAWHEGQLFRSEEHTSELQSLMRNSYAVFCLKKKNTKKQTRSQYHMNYRHTKYHLQNTEA